MSWLKFNMDSLPFAMRSLYDRNQGISFAYFYSPYLGEYYVKPSIANDAVREGYIKLGEMTVVPDLPNKQVTMSVESNWSNPWRNESPFDRSMRDIDGLPLGMSTDSYDRGTFIPMVSPFAPQVGEDLSKIR